MVSEIMESPNPLSLLALRCCACTAPLKVTGSEEVVRCPSCGTSQKVVDARAFLDQIMLQVNAWVRQAIPMGMEASAAGIVDPVARHTVFVNYVQPRLSTEYQEYRFTFLNLLSHPLGVLPFMVEAPSSSSTNPQSVFLFQAKVQSIAPLAMDEAGRASIAEVSGLTAALGYLLNNAGLAADQKPERYYLMNRNFTAAADALKNVPKFAPLSDRFKGLADLAAGLDQFLGLRFFEAPRAFEQSRMGLEAARAKASKDFDLAIMTQAIDKELSLVRGSSYLVQAASMDPSGNFTAAVSTLRKLLELLNNLRQVPYAQWRASFQDLSHSEEILRAVADIRKAQKGSPTLRVIPGQGNVLFPFWAVDVPYTFQTGALWRTQGVEVTEAMLVAATFPLDSNAFAGTDVSGVLTDVFLARERSGFFNEAYRRATGRETSISGGGPVRDALARAQMTPVGSLKVIPPLTTVNDTATLVQNYLIRVRQFDRTVDKQLRLSSPRVAGLVYAPGSPVGIQANVLPRLGGIGPRSVGDLATLASIAL